MSNLIIRLGILAAIVVVAFSLFINTRNEGIAMEKSLHAQYLNNQNELFAFKSSLHK